MLITVKTFNGHNINDGSSYQSVLLNPHSSPDATPIFIQQSSADSIDAGVYTVNVQNKVLSIRIRNHANREVLIAQLKTWFKRGTRGDLVVTFRDDGVDYQLSCRVVSLVQETDQAMLFTAILQTGTTAWRAVTETVHSTWTVTGTSETEAISVGGKDETFLSVDITTVAGPSAGYLYHRLYRLPNTPGLAHGLIPWCITLNTATLVSGGKMQADCDDLRIIDLNTGQELKRWIANPNNASTKVWVVLNLLKGFSLTLGTTVASSGAVTSMQFAVTDDNKRQIGEMPKQGIIYHGNEWFSYTNTDPVNCKLTIGQRGLFGTTVEAHSAGVSFLYIQYPLQIKYGNSVVAAPSTTDANYDSTKPLFNLSSSSNTSWVWDATSKFYDPDYPNRVPAWQFRIWGGGPLSKIYHIKQDAASGDPAIGLKVMSYQVGSVWQNVNPILSAKMFRAAKLTSISMTGESYRNTSSWPTYTDLRAGTYDYVENTLWAESSPGSPSSWATWTHNSVSVSPAKPYVWFELAYGFAGAANAFAAFEMLTCTMNFDSANIPTGTLLSETGGHPLALTIENLTTGDAIRLDYMMLIGKTFSLDGETQVAQYDGFNAYGAVTTNDPARSPAIRLSGGVTNSIKISAADLGQLSVVLSWYRRRL